MLGELIRESATYKAMATKEKNTVVLTPKTHMALRWAEAIQRSFRKAGIKVEVK